MEDGYDLSELADPVLGQCDHEAIGDLLNNAPLSFHDDKLANLEVGGTMEMENFEESMFEISDAASVSKNPDNPRIEALTEIEPKIAS